MFILDIEFVYPLIFAQLVTLVTTILLSRKWGPDPLYGAVLTWAIIWGLVLLISVVVSSATETASFTPIIAFVAFGLNIFLIWLFVKLTKWAAKSR